MRALAAAAALVVVALAGCGGPDVNETQWQADVERDIGHPIDDWVQYRDVWLDVCDEDEDGFGLFMAVSLDNGSTADQLRTNVRHACPDRLADLEDALHAGDDVDQACDTPPAERTDDQEMLAEAMGC